MGRGCSTKYEELDGNGAQNICCSNEVKEPALGRPCGQLMAHRVEHLNKARTPQKAAARSPQLDASKGLHTNNTFRHDDCSVWAAFGSQHIRQLQMKLFCSSLCAGSSPCFLVIGNQSNLHTRPLSKHTRKDTTVCPVLCGEGSLPRS